MENQEKKRSLGQKLAIELGGDVLGMGAGVLVGGAALGIVGNIPGIGKPMKILLTLGAYGLEIATMFEVRDASQKYIGEVFDAIDDVKKIFAPKKPAVAEPVTEVESEVK